MTTDTPPRFVVSQMSLQFLLSLFALCGVIYGGVSFLIENKQAVAANKDATISLKQEMKDADGQIRTELQQEMERSRIANDRLTSEVAKLGDAVVGLTLGLKEIQVVQRQTALSKSR